MEVLATGVSREGRQRLRTRQGWVDVASVDGAEHFGDASEQEQEPEEKIEHVSQEK